jgi:hypothetical protein
LPIARVQEALGGVEARRPLQADEEGIGARKREREKEAEKKAAANKRILDAVAKVKWPLTEKHLDVLFDLVFRRFGYAYQQPVASRHGIKAIKTTDRGYERRDLETPLAEMAEKNGKTGKLQLIFEIALRVPATTQSSLRACRTITR